MTYPSQRNPETLEGLGIGGESYLMLYVYEQVQGGEAVLKKGYPVFVKVGDIGLEDQALIATGFLGMSREALAAKWPWVSSIHGGFWPFKTISQEWNHPTDGGLIGLQFNHRILPAPNQQLLVAGIVEVLLW
ncbi:MAG TPA: hypothetical protein V6D29_13235 [Leptolyngbyaceae cyanobacterium]